jgi:serine/threonine protein kinase
MQDGVVLMFVHLLHSTCTANTPARLHAHATSAATSLMHSTPSCTDFSECNRPAHLAAAGAAAARPVQDVRLPESSIHDFGRDMVVALQFLHANSIIYCDIKPSNILLDENGRLKLGGFGLSRRLSDINKNPVTNLPPVSVLSGVHTAACSVPGSALQWLCCA